MYAGNASGQLLEPFGAANEMPVFAFRKVIVDGIYPIGGGKHLRIRFKKAGLSFYAVYFGMTEEDFPYNVGDIVDVAATCEVNEFNGENRVSVKIRDVRPSSLSQERLFCGNLIYDGYKRGEQIPGEDVPERGDIAVITAISAATAHSAASLTCCSEELPEKTRTAPWIPAKCAFALI